MDDLISRQAAIDALRGYLVEKRCPDDGTLTCRLIENEVINKLPPVQSEHCEDAVSREAVLSMIDTYMNKSVELHYLPTSDGIKKLISILPSVQPEHKTGRWIPSDSELEIKCNKCGKDFSEYVDSIDYIYLAEYPKFCPNCGVKMEGGEQNDKLD